MSDISVRSGLPLPVLTPVTASAIPIGRSDTLERNVAAILGVDYEAFVKAPPIAAIPAAPVVSADEARSRIPIVASVACLAVVAAGIAFAVNAPVRAPSPPPARIAVAGPLPPVAPVPPRPVPAPVAPPVVTVANATPVTRLVVHKEERAATPVRPGRSPQVPSATVRQASTAIVPPEGSADKAAPAEPDAPVTRLADRDAKGASTVPIANTAPAAMPASSAAAPEVEAKAPPAKARTEAIEAIRMLRRQ